MWPCTRKFFIATLGLVLFASCEEPIHFDIDDQARLVIYSNFSNQQTLEVYVSKTRSVFSTDPTEFVEDATVMVFQGNDLLEILQPVPFDPVLQMPPHYKTLQMQPQIGVVYTIKVTAPGFEPVTATNSIPHAVPIESVDFSTASQNVVNESKTVKFDVSVTFHDPADEVNYYHLVFHQRIHPYVIDAQGDTVISELTLHTPLDVNLADPDAPATRYFDGRSFLIKDQFFNGEKISFPFNGSFSYNPVEFLPGEFIIELRSVSEAYYLYHITISRQFNTDNPFAEGVVVYDNVENGEGIFAGYSSSFNSFKSSN